MVDQDNIPTGCSVGTFGMVFWNSQSGASNDVNNQMVCQITRVTYTSTGGATFDLLDNCNEAQYLTGNDLQNRCILYENVMDNFQAMIDGTIDRAYGMCTTQKTICLSIPDYQTDLSSECQALSDNCRS